MTPHASAILPPALRPGAPVGVVAPSTAPRGTLLSDTVEYWDGLGHPVVLGRHVGEVLGGYLGGSAEQRAADLNEMIRSEEVGLIVADGGKRTLTAEGLSFLGDLTHGS